LRGRAGPPDGGQSLGIKLRNICSCLHVDAASDWSPIHDAAYNGRILALQRLIAQAGRVVAASPLYSPTSPHRPPTPSPAPRVLRIPRVSSSLDGFSEFQHGAASLGTSQSSSPIHRAAAKGHPECIEHLVQYGADVDQHIDKVGSPLQVACNNQHLSTVKKLLQLGACVSRTASGDSPLHIAARLSSPELVSVLLDHGADRFSMNSEGKRPLDLATPSSPAERLLRQAGGIQSKLTK
uniref:Uncharacterized protein n=1 Tax=Amphiprion percula TaxID=161767 RepID=A0A3P8U9N1_AMPPE